ncbi:unnamed protein product [Trichobilharzia regenti]|nr:unnamed protein product [Trichobilharzia regenti]
MNSTIPYRNMLVNGRESSFPYENSMSYSQYNFPASSTQVMHSAAFNNTNTTTTNNNNNCNDMNKVNTFQHFEQHFPIRNTNCLTKYSQQYPDNDNNSNNITTNNNTGYNRNLPVNVSHFCYI